MSSAGRAPGAYSNVGRIHRNRAPSPLLTGRTPTPSSVSDRARVTGILAPIDAPPGIPTGASCTLARLERIAGRRRSVKRLESLRAALEARRAPRDHVTGSVHAPEREAHDVARRPAANLLVAPACEASAEIPHVEPERVADVHKRVRPVEIIGQEPV